MAGLITFGQNIQVHVIGYTDCAKCYVLQGEKECNTEQIRDLLALRSDAARIGAVNSTAGINPAIFGASRFLQPASEGEFMMTSILEELDTDPCPVPASQRPKRAPCTSLSVAVGILECTYARNGARVELLVVGPRTVDPVKIFALELGDTVRSHSDIEKDNAPFHSSALKAFDEIATGAVNAGHAIDVWSCSLNQVGSYEMKSCVDRTGGVLVISESFEHPMFKNSFEEFFATDEANQLTMGFQSLLDIIASWEIRIAGVIGPVASPNKDGPSVSTDMEIGIDGQPHGACVH